MIRSISAGLLAVIFMLLPVRVSSGLNGLYDPETGEFSLLVESELPNTLLGYVLIANPPNVFRVDQHVRILDVVKYDSTAIQIGEVRAHPPAEAGLHTLGNILPPGLSEPDLERFFERRSYLPALGYGTSLDIDLIHGASNMVPINFDSKPRDLSDITFAQRAVLVYDRRNGGIWIDSTGPDGGTLLGVQIRDNGAGLISDAFELDVLHDATPDRIGFVDERGFPPGLLLLGKILPAGLNDSTLRQRLSGHFTSKPGTRPVDLDVDAQELASSGWSAFSVISVPEPSTSLSVLWLFGFALVLFVRRCTAPALKGEEC